MRARRLVRLVVAAVGVVAAAEVALWLTGQVLLVQRRRAVERAAGPVGAAFRMLHVGESTTFGFSVDPADAYPAQLARLLEARHPGRRFVAFNRGVPGVTSAKMRRAFPDDLAAVQPDLVLVLAAANDFNPRLNPLAAGRDGGLVSLAERSRVYRALDVALDLGFGLRDGSNNINYDVPRDEPRIAAVRAALEANLQAMVDACRAANVPIVLVGYMHSPRENVVILTIARRAGVPFVATWIPPEQARRALYVADGWHPSALGHRHMAERLATAVEPMVARGRGPEPPPGK